MITVKALPLKTVAASLLLALYAAPVMAASAGTASSNIYRDCMSDQAPQITSLHYLPKSGGIKWDNGVYRTGQRVAIHATVNDADDIDARVKVEGSVYLVDLGGSETLFLGPVSGRSIYLTLTEESQYRIHFEAVDPCGKSSSIDDYIFAYHHYR